MTDRELLEAAAKAAGIEVEFSVFSDGSFICFHEGCGCFHDEWNPLTDDGDALRLAVRLRMNVDWESADCVWCDNEGETVEGDDPYAATRRAIVRAAAEIGSGMK
jgi:hypothetical protein